MMACNCRSWLENLVEIGIDRNIKIISISMFLFYREKDRIGKCISNYLKYNRYVIFFTKKKLKIRVI
jgi:hypothetical protein